MFEEDLEFEERKIRDWHNKSKKKNKIRDRFGKSRKNRMDDEESMRYFNDFKRGMEED